MTYSDHKVVLNFPSRHTLWFGCNGGALTVKCSPPTQTCADVLTFAGAGGYEPGSLPQVIVDLNISSEDNEGLYQVYMVHLRGGKETQNVGHTQ